MKFQVIGCSHHNAPISVRERLAFSAGQARSALACLQLRFPDTEAVLLSTCNRVELYVANTEGSAITHREAADFFAERRDMDPTAIVEYLYVYDGRESVRHLFIVVSSLDSMVVGEPQISSQVKQAYQLATEQKATGPFTHALFQAAARVSRCVATETAIHRRRVSIPSVAVADFGRQIFERFDNKRTLVIGAGEMAEETLQYLRHEGTRDVTVINRSPQRATELAARHGGRTVAWEELFSELALADIVISTTGADEPIVTSDQFRRIEASRRGRPLFVLDLAVPRDFESAIGNRSGVFLYSVDDLQLACQENQKARENELPSAMRIVEKEADRFIADLHRRAMGPFIRQLRQGWEKPKVEELQRLWNKLPELDESARNEVRRAFDRLTNKLFHPPLESLRIESQNGTPNVLISAVTKLFRFEDKKDSIADNPDSDLEHSVEKQLLPFPKAKPNETLRRAA